MIAIVDYKAGNLTSVKLALKEIGEDSEITSDREVILKSERVVFPGVGAAGATMENINQLGIKEILQDALDMGKPVLGICVGAQVVLDSSQEDNNTSCMGFIPGHADRFVSTANIPLKIPQIGWNQVDFTQNHPLFEGIPSGADFYFVHSYYPVPKEDKYSLATTVYGNTKFSSVIGENNLIACQFHLEKSGKMGLQILKNFSGWDGKFEGTVN